MGSKKGRIKAAAAEPNPSLPKKLRGIAAEHAVDDREGRRPTWSLALLDHEHDEEWSWTALGTHTVAVLDFLRQMERLTWREIRSQIANDGKQGQKAKPKHHEHETESLGTKAIERLVELELDDVTSLFRFRLGGEQRLWGVLLPNSNVFCPLWWDPDHRVYPLGG